MLTFDEVTRPYPNEHSARLQDPGKFSDKGWSRVNGGVIFGSIKVPKTIAIVRGKYKGKDKPTDPPIIQSLRFPTEHWTVAKARAWLKKNKIKFISFETATGKEKAEGDNGKVNRAYCGEDENGAVRMGTIDKEKHTAEFVIGTDTPVRDSLYGPPVSLSMREGAVVLKDYRKNPVILAQHKHGVLEVVGKSIRIWPEEHQIIALGQFDVGDELGERTWGKIERGFLRATSLSYYKIRMREIEEGQTDAESGFKGPFRKATQWRLLEWSVVAVGADAQSLGREYEPGAEVDDVTAVDGVRAFSLPDIPKEVFKL